MLSDTHECLQYVIDRVIDFTEEMTKEKYIHEQVQSALIKEICNINYINVNTICENLFSCIDLIAKYTKQQSEIAKQMCESMENDARHIESLYERMQMTEYEEAKRLTAIFIKSNSCMSKEIYNIFKNTALIGEIILLSCCYELVIFSSTIYLSVIDNVERRKAIKRVLMSIMKDIINEVKLKGIPSTDIVKDSAEFINCFDDDKLTDKFFSEADEKMTKLEKRKELIESFKLYSTELLRRFEKITGETPTPMAEIYEKGISYIL